MSPKPSLLSLTPKQKAMLDFIRRFTEQNGYAPSQKEIAGHFGFSSLGTVQNYLSRLQEHGLLQKDWNARRGILLAHPTRREALAGRQPPSVALPLAGRVAAGRPIEAIETQDRIDVPLTLLKGNDTENLFVLRVAGESMIEDGILDGDFAIIRKQARAENGQTVVALLNGEATIKRYRQARGRVELIPANPRFKPLVVIDAADPDQAVPDFKIEGVLVALLRRYS